MAGDTRGRNLYRHEYDNVAVSFIWTAITKRLSPLLDAVNAEIGVATGEP